MRISRSEDSKPCTEAIEMATPFIEMAKEAAIKAGMPADAIYVHVDSRGVVVADNYEHYCASTALIFTEGCRVLGHLISGEGCWEITEEEAKRIAKNFYTWGVGADILYEYSATTESEY